MQLFCRFHPVFMIHVLYAAIVHRIEKAAFISREEYCDVTNLFGFVYHLPQTEFDSETGDSDIQYSSGQPFQLSIQYECIVS